MALRKKKKVRYEVTGAFGDLAEGDLTEAYILLEEGDGGSALLYHSRTKGCCASIEMAHDRGDGVYVSSNQQPDLFGWVNISSQTDLDALVKNLSSVRYKE